MLGCWGVVIINKEEARVGIINKEASKASFILFTYWWWSHKFFLGFISNS